MKEHDIVRNLKSIPVEEYDSIPEGSRGTIISEHDENWVTVEFVVPTTYVITVEKENLERI